MSKKEEARIKEFAEIVHCLIDTDNCQPTDEPLTYVLTDYYKYIDPINVCLRLKDSGLFTFSSQVYFREYAYLLYESDDEPGLFITMVQEEEYDDE